MSSATSDDGFRSYSAALAQEEARLRAEHPTPDDIPSCTSHLDEFFRCHALGPQFKSMYRYGTLSVCSSKFAEFKFCLSIKTLDPEARRVAWIKRRAEWWATRRVGRSSEDVWEMRSEPLKSFPPPPPIMPDAVPENTTA